MGFTVAPFTNCFSLCIVGIDSIDEKQIATVAGSIFRVDYLIAPSTDCIGYLKIIYFQIIN